MGPGSQRANISTLDMPARPERTVRADDSYLINQQFGLEEKAKTSPGDDCFPAASQWVNIAQTLLLKANPESGFQENRFVFGV
jgi:hypothetical protein